MAAKRKSKIKETRVPDQSSSNGAVWFGHPLVWLCFVVAVASVCMYPMLANEFTNWDDLFYVTGNKLLIGPDYKGIFTQPVVSNYHPLTVLSLAMNYQMTELNPSSYLLTNYLLHLINCALVFWFVYRISAKNTFAALLTALVFAIHPMHVESVAWVSERKDVLYTLFFIASLVSYWQYLTSKRVLYFVLSMFLFVLSLLSKPAAIVLPLVLLLLDYYYERRMTVRVILEKLPAFAMSLGFAILTLQIQSAKAVSSLESISIALRPLFASYSVMTYLVRFFVPYPLSAFHPYPPMDNLGFAVYISPLVVALIAGVTWLYRRNRHVVFGVLFSIINLILVIQLISFGNTIVSERYTYVPYIGLAFLLSMLVSNATRSRLIPAILLLITLVTLGPMTYRRVQVWHDSSTLWTDVISHYPYSAVPRTNRANHVSVQAVDPANEYRADAMNLQAISDCDTAQMVDPKHAASYRIRGIILLRLGRAEEALRDADSLKKLLPDDVIGYSIGGTANLRLKRSEPALQDFNRALQLNPDDPEMLNNRGTTLFNFFAKYQDALADFTRAIEIKPDGNYFLNRSRCYYMLGDRSRARSEAETAVKRGAVIDKGFLTLVGL